MSKNMDEILKRILDQKEYDVSIEDWNAFKAFEEQNKFVESSLNEKEYSFQNSDWKDFKKYQKQNQPQKNSAFIWMLSTFLLLFILAAVLFKGFDYGPQAKVDVPEHEDPTLILPSIKEEANELKSEPSTTITSQKSTQTSNADKALITNEVHRSVSTKNSIVQAKNLKHSNNANQTKPNPIVLDSKVNSNNDHSTPIQNHSPTGKQIENKTKANESPMDQADIAPRSISRESIVDQNLINNSWATQKRNLENILLSTLEANVISSLAWSDRDITLISESYIDLITPAHKMVKDPSHLFLIAKGQWRNDQWGSTLGIGYEQKLNPQWSVSASLNFGYRTLAQHMIASNEASQFSFGVTQVMQEIHIIGQTELHLPIQLHYHLGTNSSVYFGTAFMKPLVTRAKKITIGGADATTDSSKLIWAENQFRSKQYAQISLGFRQKIMARTSLQLGLSSQVGNYDKYFIDLGIKQRF